MVTTRKIRFGDGLYYSLSNFSAHQIVINGHQWPTSEHAYQQSKFLRTGNYDIRHYIKYADSPAEAKEIAHKNRDKYCKAWRLPSFKIWTMYQILLIKAHSYHEVRAALYLTQDREIVELNPGDTFWAGCSKDSQNWLGKCWMRVRSEMYDQINAEFNNKST